MALALPYPDMDFVPLDILTAAEQDQLVANIEYIANQFPLTGTNIGTGAVTEDKIDFTTFANYGVIEEIVGTTTGNDRNYCIKYTNGVMIAVIRKTFANITFSAWGSCYEHTFGSGWLGNYAVAFTSAPAISYGLAANAGIWLSADTTNNPYSTTTAPNVEIVRPNALSTAAGAITLVAYGFWK